MWIVRLAFTGDQRRLAARPAHRERLVSLHADRVVRLAGPLAGDSGAVIVFDVPDRPTLDAVMAADPYFTTSGVTVKDVAEWEPFIT